MAFTYKSTPSPAQSNPPAQKESIVIPNTIPCLFCGGTMIQSGPQYAGSGVNSLTYSCPRCNAVCSHFWHPNRKIRSIDHAFHYADEEEKTNG